jgi:hypothetical protein
MVYLLLLGLQYGVVRQSASNYGIRMVTTVLSLRAAKEEPKKPARAPKDPTQERLAKVPRFTAKKKAP